MKAVRGFLATASMNTYACRLVQQWAISLLYCHPGRLEDFRDAVDLEASIALEPLNVRTLSLRFVVNTPVMDQTQ
jgi:hypothetical protein